MGALLDLLRYHRDALEALRGYGNADSGRYRRASNALELAKMQIPEAVSHFRAEADDIESAGNLRRAEELRDEADALEDFLDGKPDPAPPAPKRRRGR